MASSGATGGSSTDCEGEEQEDPSSSSFHEGTGVENLVANLNIQEKEQIIQEEDELSAFRQQWQRELESSPTPQKESSPKADKPQEKTTVSKKQEEDELFAFRQQWQRELESTPTPQKESSPKADKPQEKTAVSISDEERAKAYFLRGAELERGGKWYEAIQQYKRAMQIMPDIETRLYATAEGRDDTPQEQEEQVENETEGNRNSDSDEEEMVEGEELLARIQRIQARKGTLCEPNTPTKEMHLSCLPYEVILLIARWVVSSELDAMSLERLGEVCRGLYLVARDHDIWRTICIRTWGIECGSFRSHGCGSWREMYVTRARLQLHGCYISKTTYLRHGDNSFQDQFYRPWYVIHYYRYLRFFPDGGVLMWTTPEEPGACVAHLRHRNYKPGLGIMAGDYRLIGDKVVIVIKKSSTEKKSAQPSNTRFRSRIKEVENEQIYHLELQLRSVKSRRNSQLVWRAYAVSARRDQWSSFDLTPANFPPFAFSAVRHYSREARAPLTRWSVTHYTTDDPVGIMVTMPDCQTQGCGFDSRLRQVFVL